MKQAYRLFELEIERQRQLGYSEDHDADCHGVPDFLLLLEKQLNDAKAAWYRSGDVGALAPIVQMGALVVACIDSQYDIESGD